MKTVKMENKIIFVVQIPCDVVSAGAVSNMSKESKVKKATDCWTLESFIEALNSDFIDTDNNFFAIL